MLIGLPKEIKDNEHRVGLTPGSVKALTRRGHQILVQSGAGAGSSLFDEEYQSAGAQIGPYAEDTWAADMVLDAVRKDTALQYGLNTYRGAVTYVAVAEAFGLKHTDPTQALGDS